jgi:hypothetical protein
MVLCPRIKFKAIEGDTLLANRDVRELRTNLPVEPILVHAEVVRRVPYPDEPWSERGGGLDR